MTSDLLEVTARAVLSLITLFLVTKMLGKKQVSQLSLFDYVIGISIGNFAAEMTINLESEILHGTLAVIIFGLIAYAISILTMKSIKLRRFFMDIPTIIIENGVLLEESLKKVKYDINDFLEQCREQGYFDISEISYAVMESSGKISILPKSENKPVTRQDMKVKAQKSSIVSNLIIDGKVMQENLKAMKKDEKWLQKQLNQQGRKQEQVLLATFDNNNNFTIYEKNSQKAIDVLE